MSQFKPEEVKGLVRTEQGKGDERREKPYTAVLTDGRKVHLDASEAKTLEKRLAKDRSRMEREGTRDPEREQPKRPANPVASAEAQREWMRKNFSRSS